MKFDINAARSAGYSDDEIADYLASENKFDLGGALSSGYSASDVIDYLSQPAPAPAPDTGDETARLAVRYPEPESSSFADSLRESAGQFGDTMAKMPGGLGLIGSAISGIANREQAPAAPAQPAQKPAPQPTPYRDRVEALDDAVNLLEEGYDQAKVAESFAQGGITFDEIVAHGQKRGSEYFKQQPAAPVDPEVASLASRFPAPVTGEIRGFEPSTTEEIGNLVTRGIETGGRTIDVLRNRAGLGMSDEFLATRIAQRQRRIEAARPGTSLQDDMQAIADAGDKGLFEAATAIAQNPTATLAMIAESVIATAPAAAASVGGFAINPLAGTAAAFGSGAAMEYGATIVDTMIDAGMNPSDPASVARALANPELMAKAEERGLKRGLTVGAFSALTAGVASRFAKPILQAVDKGQIGRAAGLSAGAAGTGIVGDSVGEAAAQTVVGDPLNYSDILIEGLAGGPGSIADVGGASIAAARNDPARQIAREIDNAVFNFTPETNLTAQAGLAPIVVPNVGASNVSTTDLSGPAATAGGQLAGDLGGAGLGDAGLVGVDAGGDAGAGTGGLVPVGGETAPVGGATRQQSSGVGLERVAPRATDADLLARTEASIASQENNNANTQPVEQWFGRKGDGYITQADAQQALPGRKRMFADLDWQVEQMANGKFRLAGYQSTETTGGTQTPQAQQAEAQGQAAPVASARQLTELEQRQPALPDAVLAGLSRNPQSADIRGRTQSYLDSLVAAGRMPEVPQLGTPDVDAEGTINALGNLFGAATGIGNRVVAYSQPGGDNGFALSGIAFVNTAMDSSSVDAPRTAWHELRHVAEQLGKAGNKAAQEFTAQMDSIFDDMTDAGKRAYIERFMFKSEISGIADPAAREARIVELMQSPQLRSEMVADFLGNRSQDRKFLIDLAQADPQGFEGFVKKWLAVIDNLIAKLRGGKTQGQKESAKVDEYVRDLNKAKMVARDALIAFRKGNIGEAQTQVEGESLAASERQVYDPSITGVINGRSTDAETGQGIPAIAATDGPVSGRDGRGQIPAYGRAREGSISVVGRHYSTQERAKLNGAFYGRGLKGAERTRLESSNDSRLRSRIYFYVDQGAGIRPESGVGGFAHEVQLNNVYDPATKLVGPQADINAFESAVIDAGFDGYIAPFGNNQSAVVLLGPKHLSVPVRGLGRVASAPAPEAKAPTTVKRGLLSRELNAINTDNIAGARISAGSLVVPADQTQAANAELERIGSDIRFSKVQTVVGTASIEENFKLAQSRNWQKGRDLKLEMQQRVLDAAMAAGVDVSVDSPAAREYLREIGMADALVALKQNPNAIGWYDLKTRQALATMALVHPEIGRDENARFAFTWALAVTSNGLKVGKNFELAEKTYEIYKRDGRMPSNIGVGTAGGQIDNALDLFNELKDAWGMDNLRKFMQANFTVSEITGISKALKPGGEHADVVVKGASILGPKIGNGFFSNLYGNFDSLTMDRWLVRTWGRWTATLIKPMPEQTAKARDRLSTNIAQILKDPAETQRLSGLIDAEITIGMDVDVLAGAVQKASMDPDIRAKLNESDEGLELRKAGNSLAKYLDGQKEAPANPDERKYIRAIFGDVLSDLRKLPEYEDLTMADLQAVLWYAEKRLYETAKTQADQNVEEDAVDEDVSGYADDEAPDYANAAASVARGRGVSDRKINATLKRIENERSRATRPADAGGNEQGQDSGREQPPASGGFTRQEKRKFIGERAVLRARTDRARDAQQPGAYQRDGGENSGRVRVLKSLGVSYTEIWKIAKPTSTVFRANDIAAPEFLQLARTPENAAKFQAAMSQNKAAHPYGAAVYVYSPEEYQAMRLLLSKDGTSGVAIKPDGDIVSVFSTAGAGRAVMELAVAAGGRKLDAFETVLPEFYAPHGFRAVARTRWNDEFAPAEWNKDTFSEFNGGEPDVVFMVFDPTKMDAEYSPKDGRVMQGEDGYDRAVAAQTREMRKVARDNKLPDVPAFSKRDVVSTDDSAADQHIQFSKRQKPDPKKTVKAYKLFRVDARKPGQLFPLFVDANTPVQLNEWLDADIGAAAAGGKVKSKIGPLAFRPGWHAGDLPIATHIGEKSSSDITAPDLRPDNQVWAEVEMAADRDWQTEATKRGTNASGKVIAVRAHITDQIPVDGYYRYKTNANMTGNWLIGGSMKVTRILSDAEVEAINKKAGAKDLPRSAPFDPAKYGFDEVQYSARETNALGLYSELAVKLDAGPAQAMGEQWMAYIKGLTTKGVKQDEITWSGVEEWIKLQDGKIKKQDIVDYVKANGVQVEEVVLGGPEPELTGRSELGRLYDEAIETAMAAEVSTNPDYIRSLDPEDRAPEEQDLLDAYDAVNENPEESALYESARPTKYEQYTLPGGENYREVLITLPSKKEKWVMRQAEDGRWEVLLSDGSRSLGFFKTEGSAGSELAYANRSAGESQKGQYKSSHWNDPNVVAHLRLNDRTDATGGRVLFVEELQSDWGQEGKKKGFKRSEAAQELAQAKRELFEVTAKFDGAKRSMAMLEDLRTKPLYLKNTDAERARMDKNYAEAEEEYFKLMPEKLRLTGLVQDMQAAEARAVPTAPFVGKTDAWLGLALKRVVTMAVDGGYDKVAFVNGQQSADRYDLSTVVPYVQWYPRPDNEKVVVTEIDGADVTLRVNADRKIYEVRGGRLSEAVGKPLEDVFGKELTERVYAKDAGSLSGDGLKIGGTGMITFYDKIVPNAVNALLKKVSGGKLGTIQLGLKTDAIIVEKGQNGWLYKLASGETQGGFESAQEAYAAAESVGADMQQPGFDVTDAMRDAAAQGLPMFSKRQAPDTPAFQRWFGDSKVVDADGKPLVVYTGTSKDFDFTSFKIPKNGAWFTVDTEVASSYALDNDSMDIKTVDYRTFENVNTASRVMPVFLSIKNPAELSDADMQAMRNATNYKRVQGQIFDRLRAEGFDGVDFGDGTWVVIGSPKQIKSATGNNGSFDPANPDIRRSQRQVVGQNFTMPEINAVDRARRVLQDDSLRMKRVIEAVKAKGGVVGEAQNFYDANTLMPGRVQAAMDEFKDNVIAPMAQKAAEYDIDFDELSLYAYAKHARERNYYIASINKRFPDGGSGMKSYEANQILKMVADSGKQDQYDELHRDLMSITSTTRQVMLTDGLITPEEFDQLENAYEFYIPLRGLENVDEETGAMRPGIGRGVNVRGGETLRALGRKSRAGDLIENAIRDYQRAISRVEKNDVGKVLLDFVLSNPDPDLWGVDIERSKPSFDKKRGVVQYTTTIEKGEDTIGVKVGGQQVYIKFADKDLTRALRQAWKDEVSGLERATLAVSGWWNNWMRGVLTRYNPVFAAINIPRDALWSGTSAALADLGPKGLGRYLAAYGKAMMAASRQEAGIAGTSNKLFGNPVMDKMFQEFRAAGGVTGGFYMKSLEDINTDLRTQLMLAGANPKSIAEIAKNNLWNQFPLMSKALQASGMSTGKANKLASYVSASSVARTLEFLGSASENATRFALYIAARESGKTPVEAGLLAKNGTTNFNRKGEWGGALNNMYLFYNAAVQGTSQLLYVLKKPAVQTAMAGVAGTAAMLAFYGAAAGGEDDDGEAYWDKIPSYVKERNLVIMLPPGEALGDGMERVGKRGRYILVPVQYGFNIFPNMGYMVADVIRNQNDPRRGVTPTKAALHMASVVFGSLNPFGGAVDLSDGVQVLLALAPTITDLPIQLANERGTFGTPSAPDRSPWDLRPDSERMFPSQMDGLPAKIAKALNELGGGNEAKPGSIMGVETSITPGTIQTIIGATTGGLGTFAEQMTSSIVATTSDDKDLKANRIPFVNRFYGEVDEDANIRKAGDRMREVAKVAGEIEAQFKLGMDVTLGNEDQRMLSLSEAQEDYRKAMSEMRKEEIAVIKSDMTEPEKKLVRQQIKKARDELATVMNRVYLDTLKQQK